MKIFMDAVRLLFSFRNKLFPVLGRAGVSLLEVAHANKVPLQGACEGSLACTTCHVILDKNTYDNTSGTISEREEDLLDQAKSLTSTSRLGCQLVLSPVFKDKVVKIPNISKNIGDEISKIDNRKDNFRLETECE